MDLPDRVRQVEEEEWKSKRNSGEQSDHFRRIIRVFSWEVVKIDCEGRQSQSLEHLEREIGEREREKKKKEESNQKE